MHTGQEQHEERLAAGHGWFSLGLGLAEMAAPGSVAQLIGMRDDERTRKLLRAFGAREIASGVGILAFAADTPGWLWARVAGDALDLTALTASLRRDDADRARVAAGIASVAGVMVADVLCARQLGRGGDGARTRSHRDRSIRVSKTFTINRPPDQVYRFWRQLENLPQFMRHLESVELTGGLRSRWRAAAPAGMTVEWEAEIVEDIPNKRIAWRSIKGSGIENSGEVRFEAAPGQRGTELHVELRYRPPAGKAGALIAKLFGEEPHQQLDEDLRRFKQLLETGEIPRSAGSSVFTPVRPLAEPERELIAGGRR